MAAMAMTSSASPQLVHQHFKHSKHVATLVHRGQGCASSAVIPRRAQFLSKTTSITTSRRTLPVAGARASTAEPRWKQKVAAAEEVAEKSRRATALAQAEYKKKQAEIRVQQDLAKSDVVSLDSLEFTSYLTEEGKFTDCSKADAKASVYGIFNEAKVLEYVGVTRAVSPSLKLHFARMPAKCFYVKVAHLTRPSRALLESIRDKWISDSGVSPGNDHGIQQNMWENPLDCKPLMTDEEKEKLQEAAPGPPTAKVLKNVARRLEADLQKIYSQRNCSEVLRFDPKLKDRALLDLKNIELKKKNEPDSAVPSTNINPAAATAE